MAFGTMDRRRFLKLAGLGAGVAAAGPAAVGVQRWLSGSRQTLRIGLMLPSGSRYPHMPERFMQGLRLGFDQARAAGSGIRPTFVTADVVQGYGRARDALRSLLDGEQRADVVVAGITAPVASRLAAEMAERRVPLLVANVGAHAVRPADRSPYVLHNSLNYWQASFGMGTWAASNLGHRALVATSAPDAGYDTIYAFRQGMRSAGGRVVGTVVTPEDPDAAMSALKKAIRSRRPDFVYGLYSASDAVSFVRAYDRTGPGLPLAGTGFMVDPNLLGSEVRSALGVTTCMPWSESRSTGSNASFLEAFQAGTGHRADPFAVLGFDTANLIVAGTARAGLRGLGTSGLVRALSGVTIDSPRGTLTVDPATNTVVGPLFIQQVRRSGLGASVHEVDAPEAVGAFPEAMAGLEPNRSAYLNEYLCS
jgi:branched-chain amino acid transport system substrate-binding protein